MDISQIWSILKSITFLKIAIKTIMITTIFGLGILLGYYDSRRDG